MKLAVINSKTSLRKGRLVSRTQRPQGKPITPSLEGLVEHWLGIVLLLPLAYSRCPMGVLPD